MGLAFDFCLFWDNFSEKAFPRTPFKSFKKGDFDLFFVCALWVCFRFLFVFFITFTSVDKTSDSAILKPSSGRKVARLAVTEGARVTLML